MASISVLTVGLTMGELGSSALTSGDVSTFCEGTDFDALWSSIIGHTLFLR